MSQAKEKKLALLNDIYNELKVYNLVMEPLFLNGVNGIKVLSDDKLNEKEYLISLDNLSIVKVTALYFEAPYRDDIQSKRDAIKTCRDIFDFCHDLQVGDYSRMDKALIGKEVPRLSLYYRHSLKDTRVIVTATQRFNSTEFLFRGCEIIHELSSKLYQLTKLIEIDNNGLGRDLRWERPVLIDKQWWRH